MSTSLLARRLRPVTATLTTLALVAATQWFGAPAASAASATQVSAGQYHTCALTTAGGVKCWGFNSRGQLGDGTTTERHTPVNVSGLGSGVKAISSGWAHTCALTTRGGVKCWGFNSRGQLGDGTTTERHTPVNVSGLGSGVKAIAAGFDHTCALTTAGGVKCWGAGGILGDGTPTERHTPVDVSGLGSGVKAIAAGFWHTCALTISSGMKCWGEGDYGELGDGTSEDRLTPVNVSGLTSGVKAISAGLGFTCALTTAGGMKCWGSNNIGQLGDGTTANQGTPVDVSGLGSGVQAISAGRGDHTCALTIGGGVKCWGWNYFGQLGDATTTDRLTPVNVSGLGSGVIAISPGDRHTCALTTTGGVKCWGYNGYGHLGDGTTTDRHTPVNVSGLTGELAETSLSIKAPAKAPKGTKVTVSGRLSSPVDACTRGQTITLERDGEKSGTTKTDASGDYSFSFKLKKKTAVQSFFAKTAGCKASTSDKKTIKLA